MTPPARKQARGVEQGNRVRVPDGTAAVSADNQGSSTKVGHWETGKAELRLAEATSAQAQVRRPTKRFSLAALWGKGTSMTSRKTAAAIGSIDRCSRIFILQKESHSSIRQNPSSRSSHTRSKRRSKISGTLQQIQQDLHNPQQYSPSCSTKGALAPGSGLVWEGARPLPGKGCGSAKGGMPEDGREDVRAQEYRKKRFN